MTRVREETAPRCATKCGRPSPYGEICFPCVDAARDSIEAIEPEQLYELLLIARDEAKPANPNLIHNSASNGPKDALNLVVYALLNDLTRRWPDMLNTLHRHPEAARHQREMMQGVQSCHILTIPSDDSTNDDEYLSWKMKQITPRRPDDLVPYMREHLGIRITRGQLDQWKYVGLIKPTHTSQRNVYYHPADVLRAIDNRERQREPQHA